MFFSCCCTASSPTALLPHPRVQARASCTSLEHGEAACRDSNLACCAWHYARQRCVNVFARCKPPVACGDDALFFSPAIGLVLLSSHAIRAHRLTCVRCKLPIAPPVIFLTKFGDTTLANKASSPSRGSTCFWATNCADLYIRLQMVFSGSFQQLRFVQQHAPAFRMLASTAVGAAVWTLLDSRGLSCSQTPTIFLLGCDSCLFRLQMRLTYRPTPVGQCCGIRLGTRKAKTRSNLISEPLTKYILRSSSLSPKGMYTSMRSETDPEGEYSLRFPVPFAITGALRIPHW